MHFELKKEGKGDYEKVGGSKGGLGYLIVKIMCSLEGAVRGLKRGISKVC